MKPETMRMLEEWRTNSFEPKQGIIVTRDYSCGDDNSIELMWFANYQRDGVDHTLCYKISNIADDITAINIKIDVAEKVDLNKLIH